MHSKAIIAWNKTTTALGKKKQPTTPKNPPENKNQKTNQ